MGERTNNNIVGIDDDASNSQEMADIFGNVESTVVIITFNSSWNRENNAMVFVRGEDIVTIVQVANRWIVDGFGRTIAATGSRYQRETAFGETIGRCRGSKSKDNVERNGKLHLCQQQFASIDQNDDAFVDIQKLCDVSKIAKSRVALAEMSSGRNM